MHAIGEGNGGEGTFGHGAAATAIGLAKKAALTNALKAALAGIAIIHFAKSGKVVVRPLDVGADNAGAGSAAPVGAQKPGWTS